MVCGWVNLNAENVAGGASSCNMTERERDIFKCDYRHYYIVMLFEL